MINKRLLAAGLSIVYDGRADSHLQQRSKLRRQRESFSWAGDDLRTSFTSLILDSVDYNAVAVVVVVAMATATAAAAAGDGGGGVGIAEITLLN